MGDALKQYVDLQGDIAELDAQMKPLMEQLAVLQEAKKKLLETSAELTQLIADRYPDGYIDETVEVSYKSSSFCDVKDESKVPELYFRVKKEVDKTKLTVAINEGKIPDDVAVVGFRKNITIKLKA